MISGFPTHLDAWLCSFRQRQRHGSNPSTHSPQILTAVFVDVYRSEEFGISRSEIDVAPNCSQTEVFSTSAEDLEIKGEEWLPGLDSN